MSHAAQTVYDPKPTSRRRILPSELLLLGCSVLSLIASCILLSVRKQPWMDEIFTWKEASDPSLWHLYSAVQHGADGGQPLFYTTVWLWRHAFGGGVLTLRLYSCVAMCGALIVTWRTIRRSYGMWATAVGVLMIWGASTWLLDQNAEARFYGLYILTVAIAVDLYTRLTEQTEPKVGLLIGVLLAQAALVLTHVLGILYGGVILLALIFSDFRTHRFRAKVYLFHVAGWLALLIWIPAIRSSVAAGRPHGWIQIQPWPVVLDSYAFGDFIEWLSVLQNEGTVMAFNVARHLVQLAIYIPVAVVLVQFVRRIFARSGQRISEPRDAQRDALLTVAFALLSVPILLAVLSRLVSPVFLPRYVLPGGIGMAIILADFADTAGADLTHFRSKPYRLLWPILVGILLICPISSAIVAPTPYAISSYLDVERIDREIAPDAVVVAGWQEDFVRLMRLSDHPERYYFLLDWPTALEGPRAFVLDYHLMQAYRQAGYFSQNIRDRDTFLCTHPDFFELDTENHSWFDLTVRKMPEFEWRTVDTFSPRFKRTLFAVHRKAPLPFCSKP
jgi:Dolichyl-phosphate-mannose-protein mannosyltransferase